MSSIPWPPSTRIRIIHVEPIFLADIGMRMGPVPPTDPGARDQVARALGAIAGALAGTGRDVGYAIPTGRPATVIADQARTMSADLVVVGSRGRGPIASAMLGSVAAEVIDDAPCPVLVARAERITGIVLAHDASEGAMRGEALLTEMPFLRVLPVRVVSAWTVMPAFQIGDPPTGGFVESRINADLLAQVKADAERTAREATGRMQAQGFKASAAVVPSTPAADGIVLAAGPEDLIVLGTRGHTGVTRLLLGSVARAVLHRASSSVLVVPPPPGTS
jgi:nucleotide-binding universal stress UspA family protein